MEQPHPPDLSKTEGGEPVRRRHRRHRSRRRLKLNIRWGWWLPLAVFAAMVVLGPLLFGAVDRVVQVGLVFLLAVGMMLVPPSWLPLSRGGKILAAGIAGLLLVKELAPARWFGGVQWRGVLDLPMPWTHHPEPARVLDVLLVVAVAALWFQWVRTLAADGERRVLMAWILGGAGALVALVCFATQVPPPKVGEIPSIYGWRETQGWIGWGPFPNRNHTSSLLAMAALCLGGAVWWAVAKRRLAWGAAGGMALLLTLAALLAGKSRGGLLTFAGGLAIFLALVVWRKRDRRTTFAAASIVLVGVMGLAAFGGNVIERFRSAEQGTVSNETRVLIWREAAGMWKDAPLFGHGVDTFSQLFPLYQKADLDGKTVLHPESSWLQWLAELGLIPVALLAGAAGWFVVRQLRIAWPQRRAFYLTAGLTVGALALLAHAAIDVPGHRWGTAGFALALLAVAFPLREPGPSPRWPAAVPLAVALFWAVPFMGYTPSWSPMAPTMLLNRQTRPGNLPRPTLAEWDAALRWYPLHPWMRQYAGFRALEKEPAARVRWERDFAVARQLLPSAWWMPEMQAQAVAQRFPTEAIPLWQDAVDRAGRRWSEVLRNGVRATAQARGARVLWAQYIRLRPQMALAYAAVLVEELRVPVEDTRAFFDLWWEKFAGVRAGDEEVAIYYRYAAQWSSPAQLEPWMNVNRKRLATDYRTWMTLLRGWNNDERAWQVYRGAVPKPEAFPIPEGATRESLEKRVHLSPENASAALELVHFLEKSGESSEAARVLMTAASRSAAAPRLLREAAYHLAAEGKFTEAVDLALRETAGPAQ